MSDLMLPPAKREPTDVSFAPMLIAGVAMLVALGIMAGLAYWIYPASTRSAQAPTSLPRFAEPVLQPSPPADMAAFRAEALRQLNSMGWVDQAHGVVHIPIRDAMQAVAGEGIADWPTAKRRDR